jgi:hypothetical protein
MYKLKKINLIISYVTKARCNEMQWRSVLFKFIFEKITTMSKTEEKYFLNIDGEFAVFSELAKRNIHENLT